MGLTERERQIAVAVAQAAMPPGAVLPGAGETAVARVEAAVALAPGAPQALRAGLWALELAPLARGGVPFTRLTAEDREAALHRWADGEISRQLLRLLVTPLKLGGLSDEGVYRALGCRWAVEPPAPERPPRWRQNLVDGSSVAGETLECDVVVVGTGAGGAPVARELAERGHAVLMLEEGAHYERKDFTGRPLDMQRRMYRDAGFTMAFGNAVIPIPIGRTVGGTTTINSGTCFRAPAQTLARWREAGLSEMTEEHLEPYFRRVEQMLQVTPAAMRYVGKPGEVIARGCDALGYSHGPLPRNAPDCDGQGLCCFGCPTDAKRSTNVSYVPRALSAGAQVITGVKVERVETRGGTAVGVRGVVRTPSGEAPLAVRARVVVLACGTLHTPTLLLKNGLANGSGQVGRNLSIHPASHALALFDEEIRGWSTIPQGYAIHELESEGILFEGATAPFEMLASLLDLHGRRFTEVVEQFNQVAAFGFMIKDTSRGRVRVGPGGRPLLTYWMRDADVHAMQRGMAFLARVYLAAGAREVYPGLWGHDVLRTRDDVERMATARVAARHFDISAYHPLGTCRMGRDSRASVVSPTGETHDVRNLWITDGSALPSSLGVNPQVTIMALSTRAADLVERRLEQPERQRESPPQTARGLAFAETMSGTHTLRSGPRGGQELPFSFTVQARSRTIPDFLGVRGGTIALDGEVRASGLAERAALTGTLRIRATARRGLLTYDFTFRGDDGLEYRFHGEKHRTWSPLESLTTLYGKVTTAAGETVSTGITRFELRDLPSFLRSYRVTRPSAPRGPLPA